MPRGRQRTPNAPPTGPRTHPRPVCGKAAATAPHLEECRAVRPYLAHCPFDREGAAMLLLALLSKRSGLD
jgi:hypothetical protein